MIPNDQVFRYRWNWLNGSHVVRLLDAMGHEVDVLMRETSDPHLIHNLRYQKKIGDVTNPDSLENAISDETEWLFHNAAIMVDWGGEDHFFPVNVEGTRNVLESARMKDIPNFIFTSSTALYGFPNNDIPMTEETEIAPTNAYQRSKVAAEKLVRKICSQHGIKHTVIRPPVVFGHGDMFTGPIFIERLKEGGMYVFSGGKNVQSFVHAEDVARALVLAAEKINQANDNAYNVVSFTCEFRELLEALAKELDIEPKWRSIPYRVTTGLGGIAEDLYEKLGRENAPVLTKFRANMLGSTYIIDWSKLEEELGYEPKWDLNSTARDMVEWGGFVKPR